MWNVNKISALLIAAVLLAACASSAAGHTATPITTQEFQIPTSTSANERWVELFDRTPFPFTTPLPSSHNTAIDGTYIKINPRTATPFPCRRCPDYAMEGGLWKINFDEGIFRMIYSVNGWRSLALSQSPATGLHCSMILIVSMILGSTNGGSRKVSSS